MKWLASNIVVVIWSVIFGEVIGYVGQALEEMTYQPLQIGVTMAIAALIAVNGIALLARSDQKSAKN
ncbi:YjzD family protein [Levilactobacillus zymae]|uniref:YjzD family protein n=1 Tax=Levilactobacillus zymae TaxID=267363 RepID=UPI0028B8E205|nr:YjzD family protein [Levilactobacillus zymae]MDT6979797.1 YjzD family protein [Levilactobacillus zymae]